MVALEVLWLPQELAPSLLADSRVVVIDVIRATTSITTALAAGGQRVIPAGSVAAARAAADRIGGSLLCGAASHPGGGVMGACGRNAAQEILRDI